MFFSKKSGAVNLNVQSAKSWQSVVGHEITHVLEGTDAYRALRDSLYTFAESRGELESRREALTKLYKDIDADIEAELTADLVGDYLFTNKDFITHLTTNRNLFKKIYDEIKYLCKVATGKELTEIEKVKREFDKAWKELSAKPAESGQKNNTTESGVRYSLKENQPLTTDDLPTYLKTGIREHVRNQKHNMIFKGESVFLYTDVEIKQFISDSLEGKERNSIKAYARVGTRFADELLKISDEDVADYYLELDGNRIEHINDHVETDSDNRNIPLTDEEALELTEYIDTYTEILACVKRKDGSKRIYISKEKSDGVVVVELISKGRSSIQPVTAWKNTVDAFNLIWGQKKKATNTSLVAKTATHRGYKIVFNDSISNSDENVNTKSNLRQSVDETQVFFSLSDKAEDIGPVGDFSTPLNSLYYGEDADTVDDIGPVKDMRGAETSVTDTEDIVPVVAENAITDAPIREDIAPVAEQEGAVETEREDEASEKLTRSKLHSNIVENIRSKFSEKGFDLDHVLKKARNLSIISTVDNTPQRVMEKALGYKEGQILADITVNKVAQNETEGIVNCIHERECISCEEMIIIELFYCVYKKYGI